MKWPELSAKARERFLSSYTDDGWPDDTLCYYKEDPSFKLRGFDIREIYWRGFYNQGDGASWTGRVYLKPLITQTMLAPDDAVKREVFLALIDNGDLMHWLEIKQLGSYCHEMTMQILDALQAYYAMDTSINDASCKESIFYGAQSDTILEAIGGNEALAYLETFALDAARALAREIYAALEADFEHAHSEAVVAELAEANDWEFDEDGTLI